MKIIDTHTHCFPDFLAQQAMEKLTDLAGIPGFHNGTLNGLKQSMQKAGISKSIIQSIATDPGQSENILKWSLNIKDSLFEPFISIHPETDNIEDLLKKAKDHDIKGIKMHPHYQDFFLDDKKLFPLFELFLKLGFIVFLHAGNDIAFPGHDNASVKRIKRFLHCFNGTRTVLAHCGAYQEWEEVLHEIAGKDVYLETSFILEQAGEDMFMKIFNKHNQDKILFGTDSPWTDQKNAVGLINNLNISDDDKEKIFFINAETLLMA